MEWYILVKNNKVTTKLAETLPIFVARHVIKNRLNWKKDVLCILIIPKTQGKLST
jgi:hypothetical protein